MTFMNLKILLPVLPALAAGAAAAAPKQQPNIIMIFADDLGYQDLSCCGSPLIRTPRLDGLASEGLRLTEFYVSASVSSASRAGLMTGRFNTHNGVKAVLFPGKKGLPSEEITIAEALREQGYATGCFGKWHLGDNDGQLPTDQGFDTYFGIPYSNDMFIGPHQKFAADAVFREGYTLEKAKADQRALQEDRRKNKELKNIVPLFEDKEIIEYPCDQATTSARYIDRVIRFIGSVKDRQPFFAYITPSMPHVPLHATEQFAGKSERGLYGDCIEELDWNIGRLLDYLDENGLRENTLVIFASDNGPWLSKKEEGGCALPLRDGKFSMYEGGVRTPFIARWPGHIPAGVVSDGLLASIDLYPTFLHYAGCDEIGHEVDGIDMHRFLEKPESRKARLRDEYIYVKNGKVCGIRKGDWIYLPESGSSRRKGKHQTAEVEPELFNIREDIAQEQNLETRYPEKLQEMKRLFELAVQKAE